MGSKCNHKCPNEKGIDRDLMWRRSRRCGFESKKSGGKNEKRKKERKENRKKNKKQPTSRSLEKTRKQIPLLNFQMKLAPLTP